MGVTTCFLFQLRYYHGVCQSVLHLCAVAKSLLGNCRGGFCQKMPAAAAMSVGASASQPQGIFTKAEPISDAAGTPLKHISERVNILHSSWKEKNM